MDYVEEESRPRFVFHPRAAASSAPKLERHRPSALHAAACLSAAAVLLFSAVSLVHSQFLSSLLFWAALSLLLGPFAPPSLTGGDPRVGRGPALPPLPEPQPQPSTDPKKQRQRPRSAPSPPPQSPFPTVRSVVQENTKSQDPIPNGGGSAKGSKEMEEKEWTEEELGILRKQISRHPAGEPQRWDRIAEAFDGWHSVDSVIRMAKSLSEKKPGGGDSYAQFLKQRKPLDKRMEVVDQELGDDGGGGMENGGGDGKKESWSSGEDLVLLNALKAFPKDVPMRWEKIAAAVPGKSKASCVKRVAELKRDFRSSKASELQKSL